MSEVELAKLHAAVEGLAREFGRRFDRQDATLGSIEAQVRATNGQVIRHDEQIKALQSGAMAAAKAVSGTATADDESTFRERVRFAFWGVGGGFTAALGLLKLIGKL